MSSSCFSFDSELCPLEMKSGGESEFDTSVGSWGKYEPKGELR